MKLRIGAFFLIIFVSLTIGIFFFLGFNAESKRMKVVTTSVISSSSNQKEVQKKYAVQVVKTSTSKADVLRLLQRANSPIGKIIREQSGKEILEVKGKNIFEGYHLGRASMSSNGTIVISSYNAQNHMLENADAIMNSKNGKLSSSIASIWLIKPEGATYQITPSNIHALNPLISPDGQVIAFTGELLNAQGIPQEAQIYVVSPEGESLASLNLISKGHIVPVIWNKDQLAIITNEEENAVNFELSWLKISCF